MIKNSSATAESVLLSERLENQGFVGCEKRFVPLLYPYFIWVPRKAKFC